MSIAEKLTTIAENEQKVFDAGKKAEYDAFWDSAQENGNRTDYDYMFAGGAWTVDNFRPKYDIIVKNASHNMFCANPAITDLVAMLDSAGITLDVSLSRRVDFMFAYCANLERVPTVDASGCTHSSGINSMFSGDQKLHTIEKLIIPSDRELKAQNNAFNNCVSLENLVIEGAIGTNDWNFNSCPLSRASITSVMNALSSTASGLTVTLKKTAVEAAFGSTTASEWTALVAAKPNWTISLA